MTEPIRLAVLGATGSIGRQALEVVRAHPDRLRVVALGANRNVDELRALAAEFPTARTALGANALEDGKRVALANKEVLVAAGHLVRRLSGGAGERLRPVDSEHNGLWQCLVGEDLAKVRRGGAAPARGAVPPASPPAAARGPPPPAPPPPPPRAGPPGPLPPPPRPDTKH